jgi:DNA-binding CsgD family transcriptional regulator
MGNAPEILDYFYSQKLYFDHPYMRNPSLYRSGWTTLTLSREDQHYSHLRKNFEVDRQFMKLERRGNWVDLFFFSATNFTQKDCLKKFKILGELDLFSSFFKRKAERLIGKMFAEGFNAKKALGPLFDKPHPAADLLAQDSRVDRFLKKIAPLTPQEWHCLELFKRGLSAEQTAQQLGISRRTVEHYFENIMKKLNIPKKRMILKW